MAMVVKNNMSAISTLNTLNKNQSALGKSLAKVSSGMKINSAQDDASGYAISERMRVMIRSLDQANQNTQNGSSLMKVSEGAVSNTVEILKTLKEKAINAATDTNTDEDRAIIQKEINQLVDQIDDNALITFNGKYLIDGSKSSAGDATFNTWTNQALAEDTSALTKLTALKARDGEALTIESSDKFTVSYVQNGRNYTTIQKVGDHTLADIFKFAEAIDTTTSTFAIASNDSVKTVGGVSQLSTDLKAIEKAIGDLQDKLSYKNAVGYISLGNFGMANDATATPAVTGINTSYIKFDTATDLITTDTAGATTTSRTGATLGQLGTSGTKPLGMNTSYNGEITQKVTTALEAYKNAKAAAGTTSDTGAAKTFLDAIATYNAAKGTTYAWVYDEGALADAETKAKEMGGDVLIAFNNYKSALSNKAAALDTLQTNVKEYNEGLAQIDALIKLRDLENAKDSYRSQVTAYIADIKTKMGDATQGTVYTLPAGVAGNERDVTYTVGSDDKDKITEIANYLSDKLNGLLDEISVIGEAGVFSDKLVNAVYSIIGQGNAGGAAVNTMATDAKAVYDVAVAIGTATVSTTALAVAALQTKRTTAADSPAGIKSNVYDLAIAAIKDTNYTAAADINAALTAALVGYSDTDAAKATITKGIFHDNTGVAADGTTANKSAGIVGDVSTVIGTTTKGATYVDTIAAQFSATGYDEKLKLVYANSLSDVSGPALIIGSDVGLDHAGKTVSTLDGKVGITFTSAKAGIDGQISGFTISISDADGNVRKSVNTSLNAWSTTIYGKNASEKDNSLAFQIGASANQTITVDMADMRAEALGLKGKDGKVVDVSNKENANAAISVFENALQKALDVQTTIGAIEARLEYTASNLTTSTENVQSAESTIRDADLAKEMTEYTKNNVLLQAAQSMLAQANQNSSAVLSLLQ